MAKKKQKGKEGNAIKYITRNQALKRLQIKLSEFRRLCILKGIHPREPNKKLHGAHKTYYHIKDIKFLMREPLLEKGREIKAYEKKIKRAKGKLEHALKERLLLNMPSYTLDHLVKERYPSFIDALRDLDDGLTMINLFAVLPCNPSFAIPTRHIHTARRLSLEWQAYVTKTHALRKTFVSVKGIYYQAEVIGQKITWIIPHSLAQTIPSDVDFRVMVTFLEFYETLLSFVNFKLYHDLNLKYPPILDPRLEQLADELYSMVKNLSKKSSENEKEGEGMLTEGKEEEGNGDDQKEEKEETRKENLIKESNLRLSSLQERLASMAKLKKEKEKEKDDMQLDENEGGKEEGEDEDGERKLKDEESEDDGNDDDIESRLCRKLFKGFVFFLARETPREPLLFLIRSFGGLASWEGEGSPFDETDDSITHQVVDRPSQKHMHLGREYVQPQWLFDCVNNRILLPPAHYAPGLIPPPHLSPFVDNEVEGYVPEYGKVLERMKQEAMGLEENQKLLEMGKEGKEQSVNMAAIRNEEASMATQLAEIMDQEKKFHDELIKELSGIPFSSSILENKSDMKDKGMVESEEVKDEEEEEEVNEEAKEEEEEEKEKEEKVELKQKAGEEKKQGKKDVDERKFSQPKKAKAKKEKEKERVKENKEAEEKALAEMMMPRKTKRLYDAMKMGNAAKQAKINLLEERKKKAKKGKST